jgi:predicted nucleic acid-binding protein
MILLDTNVVSEMFRDRANQQVLNWIDSQLDSNLYPCTPVVAELRYGAERLAPGQRQAYLRAAIDRSVDEFFRDRIWPFDLAATGAYSRLMVKREQMGRRIELMDAMIAAIAITHGAALATRDTRDFADLGLDLINPFEAPVAH